MTPGRFSSALHQGEALDQGLMGTLVMTMVLHGASFMTGGHASQGEVLGAYPADDDPSRTVLMLRDDSGRRFATAVPKALGDRVSGVLAETGPGNLLFKDVEDGSRSVEFVKGAQR